MYFSQEDKEKCLYDGVVREAVAAMMVVGPILLSTRCMRGYGARGYGQRIWR